MRESKGGSGGSNYGTLFHNLTKLLGVELEGNYLFQSNMGKVCEVKWA